MMCHRRTHIQNHVRGNLFYVLLRWLCYCSSVANASFREGIRGLAKPVCGNNQQQGSEECDGTDDAACRGMCDADCMCTTSSLPLLEFFSDTVIRTTIPSTLFGTNIVYSWERDEYWNETLYDPSARQTLFYNGNAFLRYPGGEVTSYFHWDNPVGRGWSDSWAPGFNGVYEPASEWMGLDEYFTHLGSAKPLLGVNMASGWKYNRDQDGLDDAAALAALVKNKTDTGDWPNVEHWFLDNEQHLEKFNNTPWTEPLYAEHINMYATEIKKTFPDAKFVANWKNSANGWSQLINDTGENIHIMDFHSYWHRNGWATTDWNSYLDGASNDILTPSGSTYRQFVQTFKDVGGANRETAMFEWGLSPSPEGSELSRYQSAFIVADIFMQLVDSDLDHACYWPFRVPSQSEHAHRALVDDNNEPTVVRLFLQFFKEIKGYDLVQTSIGAANTGTIAAKSKSGDEVVVYILRRTSGDLTIRIADSISNIFDDAFVPTTATAVSQAAPDEDTNSTSAVWSSPATLISADGETTVTVPGWSLTRVILSNTPVCNNDGTCDQGEDSNNCPYDCTTTTTTTTTGATPATTTSSTASCFERNAACGNDSECCSGNCKGNGKCN
mmetsp:Transcript_25761/g.54448  ORF Transcript_25761/g.54448 Transcript_25761/m.54448 type:complete len:612 (-) Transcript_25761:77-1912(-)